MDILKRLVKGELSLVVTFWVFGILIDIVFFNILMSLLFSFIINVKSHFVILNIFTIIQLAINLAVCIGIYNMIKKGNKTFWSYTSLIVLTLNFIFMLVMLLMLAETSFTVIFLL